MNRQTRARFPLGPLLKLIPAVASTNDGPLLEGIAQAARTLDVSRRQMHRYAKDGIPEATADRLAVALGLHPRDIWPDEYDALAVES